MKNKFIEKAVEVVFLLFLCGAFVMMMSMAYYIFKMK